MAVYYLHVESTPVEPQVQTSATRTSEVLLCAALALHAGAVAKPQSHFWAKKVHFHLGPEKIPRFFLFGDVSGAVILLVHLS